MTTSPVPSITDEQIAEIEVLAKEMRWQDFKQFQYTAVCGQAYCLEGDEGNGGVHLLTTFEPQMQSYLQLLSPAMLSAIIARLRAAERDAGRYRWLRSRPTACPTYGPDLAFWEDHAGDPLRYDEADAAIDAAMSEAKP